MALFSRKEIYGTGQRLTGFPRFRELIERDFKRFFIVNFITLIAFLPLFSGIILALLSSSILVLIPACIVGGMIAGPALSCMYDTIFRSLRDVTGDWLQNYKHAWKQNWRQSILPGIIFSLLLGFYIFMIALFVWSTKAPSLGTIIIYIVGLLLIMLFFTIYWPQLVLFEQSTAQRLRNCILFIARFFWKMLGCAILQIVYWFILILFLPWSLIALPFIGFWFILFVINFLLYSTLDEIFDIEASIAKAYPEQANFYEDDEAWLKRKQKENKHR